MSLYVVRACRAKKGKGAEVQALLKKAAESQAGIFVYQNPIEPDAFGVFAEFANEDTARAYAGSAEQQKVTNTLAPLVEVSTDITVWKRV